MKKKEVYHLQQLGATSRALCLVQSEKDTVYHSYMGSKKYNC